jgi:FMN phosphatase YigB (HAD superfamily)
VPDGLFTFLGTVRGTVDLVLATNSPAEACFPLLKRLHLQDAFDTVVPNAGKPQGLEAIAHARWHGTPLPHRTLSIGDHYDNDIAPAWALGWSTVHISPHGYFPGPSTVRGRTLEDVLPFVWQWVESLAKDDDDGNS